MATLHCMKVFFVLTRDLKCMHLLSNYSSIGSTVVMKRRQCVAAFIIRTSVMPGTPSGTNSPAPGTRTSIFSRTFAAPPVTPPAAGGISSLYTAPITRTPERNRKTGDVYFIIDDTSVLIASPDKSRLDEGILLFIYVFPLVHLILMNASKTGLVRICFPVYNAGMFLLISVSM